MDSLLAVPAYMFSVFLMIEQFEDTTGNKVDPVCMGHLLRLMNANTTLGEIPTIIEGNGLEGLYPFRRWMKLTHAI